MAPEKSNWPSRSNIDYNQGDLIGRTMFGRAAFWREGHVVDSDVSLGTSPTVFGLEHDLRIEPWKITMLLEQMIICADWQRHSGTIWGFVNLYQYLTTIAPYVPTLGQRKFLMNFSCKCLNKWGLGFKVGLELGPGLGLRNSKTVMCYESQLLLTVWCNILVRLQGKFELDHSLEWKNYQDLSLIQRSGCISHIGLGVKAITKKYYSLPMSSQTKPASRSQNTERAFNQIPFLPRKRSDPSFSAPSATNLH